MSESENFTFNDVTDGDEVWVGIRTVEGGTGLALSKKSDGDLEVFMPPDAYLVSLRPCKLLRTTDLTGDIRERWRPGFSLFLETPSAIEASLGDRERDARNRCVLHRDGHRIPSAGRVDLPHSR
jgi:hypothetical protein